MPTVPRPQVTSLHYGGKLMNKAYTFAKRNLTETLRDTLSYIFCLGFPIIMLIIMTLVNKSIPAEAEMTIFRIDNLAGGIIIFGQTFLMLFTAITVAKDRSGSFLIRMFATPMNAGDFIVGYILPMLLLSVCQALISFAAAFIISLIDDFSLNVFALLTATVTSIPSALFFISIGLLFGSLFNDKAAPGLCSIIISLGSFLGCIWFDAESTGGIMLRICKCLPFMYCTKSVRSAIALDFSADSFIFPLLIVSASALVIALLSALAFKSRMKADLS